MGSHSVTCHPTQVNTPCLNPSQTGWYSIYLPRRDGRLSWPRWPVTYLDGLPAHRRSPIQVLTQQCTSGSRTRNLLITSPTRWPLHHQATGPLVSSTFKDVGCFVSLHIVPVFFIDRSDVVKQYYLSMITFGNAMKRVYVERKLEHQHQQTNQRRHAASAAEPTTLQLSTIWLCSLKSRLQWNTKAQFTLNSCSITSFIGVTYVQDTCEGFWYQILGRV